MRIIAGKNVLHYCNHCGCIAVYQLQPLGDHTALRLLQISRGRDISIVFIRHAPRSKSLKMLMVHPRVSWIVAHNSLLVSTARRAYRRQNMHCSKNFSCYGKEFYDKNVKISDMIRQKILRNEKFCSFEVFSGLNITEETCQQLFAGLESCCPLFYSITWHEPNQVPMESQSSLKYFLKFPNITLLHLTARGLNKQDAMHVLKCALDVGRPNIFALRGEVEMLDEELAAVDFPYAVELVKFIRSQFGSKFSICVAGYPQQHPDSSSKESDLSYLKAKVDAGADFIITQIIFESEPFINFVKDCRRIGIRVPIIPGVFLLSSYDSLLNVSKRCKADIPQRILQDLELMKEDDAAIQEYGINSSVKLIEEIFKSGTSNGIHIFTLNRLYPALELCKRVGLCEAKTNSNV